ncbi:hypothetical protein [Actinomadura miaoliensis]|uniref:PH domain-containing protein n=1 Tax=Actinomadura miaoliensis TaxID=430685 RepID=A0ABP7X0P4_9ACTN
MKSFTFNEEAAQEWVTDLIVVHELADLADKTDTREGGANLRLNLG